MTNEPFRAIERGSQSSTVCLEAPSSAQEAAFASAGTAAVPFGDINHLLTGKPLRRPNRTRPTESTPHKTAAERLVPSREDLRKIRDALPFPAGWHEEDEKPF